jgi:hypothetical protein
MSASSKATYLGDEASAIADAFRAFVKAHHLLLDALIARGALSPKSPLSGPPVAAVLRSIESVVVDVSYTSPLFYFTCNIM